MRTRTPCRWSSVVVDVGPQHVAQCLTPDRRAWSVTIRDRVLTAQASPRGSAPVVVPLDVVRPEIVDLPTGRWAAELQHRGGKVTGLPVPAAIAAAWITERTRLLR